MTPSEQRDEWVDALRVCAILGVFMVNTLGHPGLFTQGLPAGTPTPIDSLIAQTLHVFHVALLENKAYPLLCFLFGYSAYTQFSKTKKLNLLYKRYSKLLLIGLVHGLALYGGDILTIYAVIGLCAVRCLDAKLSKLLKLLRIARLCFIATVIFVCSMLFAYGTQIGPNEIKLSTVDAQSIATYYQKNTQFYWEVMAGATLLLPMFLYFFIAGIMSARLGLLSTRRLSRAYWATHWTNFHLLIALLGNVALGLASVWLHINQPELASSVIGALAIPLGYYLAAALLGALIRYRHHLHAKQKATPFWVSALAPAGRHTLAMYLALSCCLLLSSEPFLALHGSTAQRTMAALILWVIAVCTALWASHRWPRSKDPISRWLGR